MFKFISTYNLQLNMNLIIEKNFFNIFNVCFIYPSIKRDKIQ